MKKASIFKFYSFAQRNYPVGMFLICDTKTILVFDIKMRYIQSLPGYLRSKILISFKTN